VICSPGATQRPRNKNDAIDVTKNFVVVIIETPFYLQSVYIQQIGVRIGCYGLGRGTQ
jgi:hypothetical protein